jgi:hypothetical protein
MPSLLCHAMKRLAVPRGQVNYSCPHALLSKVKKIFNMIVISQKKKDAKFLKLMLRTPKLSACFACKFPIKVVGRNCSYFMS